MNSVNIINLGKYVLNSDWKKKYLLVEETASAHCDNDCHWQMGESALKLQAKGDTYKKGSITFKVNQLIHCVYRQT